MSLEGLCVNYLTTTTQDVSTKKALLEDILQSMTQKRYTLLDLVRVLGDYLTEEDVTLRAKSMSLLQGVLDGIPSDLLNGQHVSVMNQFFCERTTDDACLSEILAALISISRMRLYGREDARNTGAAIIAIVDDGQQRPQRTRNLLFSLIDVLMLKHRDILQDATKTFIPALVNFTSGEKDPRNLMMAFSILRIVLQEFDIGDHVADLFDVIYCYFPITFRAPGSDSSGITTEDLKLRLRDCLSATPAFAKHLIPALLEKLNAVALSVKKDALLTMTACFENYASTTMDLYSVQLWAALKFEITQSEDNLLESMALDTMTAITKCLANDLNDMPRQGSLARWLQPIVTEMLEQLKEPELKTAKSCGSILHSVARSSLLCHKVVIQTTLPGLLALCAETSVPNKAIDLLHVLNSVLKATLILQEEQTDQSKIEPETFYPHDLKGDILQTLCRTLVASNDGEIELAKTAMLGLSLVTRLRHMLSDEEFIQIISILSTQLVDCEGEVAEGALVTLSQISELKSSLILEYTFPTLLAKLPEPKGSFDVDSTWRVLKYLARLTVNKVIFETLIIRLYSRLDSALSQEPDGVKFPLLILSTLRQVLQHFTIDASLSDPLHFDKLVPTIFEAALNPEYTAMRTPEVMDVCCDIVNMTTRCCHLDKQREIAADIFSLFFTGGINRLVTHVDPDFRPLQSGIKSQMYSIPLFVGVYGGLSRELELVQQFNVQLFTLVVQMQADCQDISQVLALHRLVCLMINKCNMSSQLTDTLSWMKTIDRSTSYIQLLSWVCKALIMKNDKGAQELINIVVDALSVPSLVEVAIQGIAIMIGDDAFLSKSNHTIIKLLYKQKFYSYVFPSLMDSVSSVDKGVKNAYLVAIVMIVAGCPSNVYMENIQITIPILLQCLVMPDAKIKESALSILMKVGQEAADVLGSHLSSLVPALISCTAPSESHPPQVRSISLQLLGLLAENIRTDKLQPFRLRILQGVAPALDDPKRIVRKVAVSTRHKFFQTTQ